MWVVVVWFAGVVDVGGFFGASLAGVASGGGALVIVSLEDGFADLVPVFG